MQGATAALGKHEHTFSSPPGALNGDKWWTSTVQPTGNCNGQPAVGHTATVVNGCSPSWMPQYWDRVLAAVWQPVQPGGNGVCKQACMTTEGSCMLQAHSGPERGACAREMESCQARCSD
jgi:hypothetical protein